MDVAPGYIETDLNRDFLRNDKIKSWLSKGLHRIIVTLHNP